jgi:choline dehydrogenase-like flavoprotein
VKIAIVGSGPGGMTVMKKMMDYGLDVCLFEKGPYIRQKDGPLPYSVAEMDAKYNNQGVTAAFGRANVNYVEGSCLGGGSEVNAGLYHRTPSNILKKWREELGIDFADPTQLEKYFKESEDLLNVGKMPFSAPAASLKIRDGARVLGWDCTEAPRWYKYLSEEDRGVFSGIRQSMTEVVLPLDKKQNFTILHDTNVDRLLETANGKIVVVFHNKTSLKTNTREFDAVFVSCGAIGTPYLLKKSKLGPKYVGQNLKLHTSIKAVARFNERVNGVGAGIPVHQIKHFAPEFSIGGAISNLPFLAAGLSDNGVNPLELANNWEYYASYYSAITKGTGRVYCPPFAKQPVVTFDIGKEGLKTLSKALKHLCELLFAAGAIEVFPSIRGAPSLFSFEDINAIPAVLDPKKTSLMTIHIMGTCPIGVTERSCLDLNGKLKGTKNVYVADASMIPTALGVNPQGTIMALASFVASKFCKRYI